MNQNQFKTLWENNKILVENRQIIGVSITGFEDRQASICIKLNPKRSIYRCSDTIEIDFRNCWKLAKIFAQDNPLPNIVRYDTDDFIGKYIRLCFYKTPDEEMHELADLYQLVAIKHILKDDLESTTMLPC